MHISWEIVYNCGMKIKVDTRIEPTTLELVIKEAKKQNRSKSQMLRIMIEDWFKGSLIASNTNDKLSEKQKADLKKAINSQFK